MSVNAIQPVTLASPLKAVDGSAITAVTVNRPTVGALRGLQLAMVQLQDVNAMCKLLPRVTQPALTPDQIEALDPVDFAALANRVSLFFMTEDQLSAVQATS